MRLLFILLFLTLTWTCCPTAWGGDFIISRAVFEDRSGALSITEVAQATFQASDPILSKGYTDSAHWLRIVVRSPDDGGELILRIRPAFIDEIKLYEPEPAVPSGWKIHVTGDRTPYPAREAPTLVLGFIIKPTKPESVYYLRLQTTSSSILNVEALTPHQAQIKDMWLNLYQMVYLGFMLSLLFWAIGDYASGRERVMLWFIFHQITHLLHNLALMGWLAPLLATSPVGFVDKLTSIIICTNSLFAAMFHRIMLTLFAPLKLAMRGLDTLILLALIDLAIMASGHTRLALHINAFVVMLGIPIIVVLAFTASKEAEPGRRILRTVYSLLAVSLLVAQLPLLGWIQAIEWNLNAALIHGFIAACLMFVLLHLRSRQLLLEGEQALLKLALIRQQLEIERTQREEQKRFMSMLNHELKTPLSVIKMALGLKEITATVKNHAQQSIQDVDAIVERCLQADQLEQPLVLRQQPCRVDLMLIELRTASPTPQRLLIQSETLPEINTDPQLLRIALSNLIDNALKYAEPQSLIRINIGLFEHQGRQGILSSIANALDATDMPNPQRVFDKYYRGPSAYGKTGSGLGLYLVRSVTDQLGGWIRYCPSESQVKFELWIPY